MSETTCFKTRDALAMHTVLLSIEWRTDSCASSYGHVDILLCCRDKVVVAGNSLGGYNSLSLAAAHPELVAGVALLNGAGRFDDLDESAATQSSDVVELDAVEARG
jgi:esterase/lipase superfamily enzyme